MIRPTRPLSANDIAIVRDALATAGVDDTAAAVILQPPPSIGHELWSRALDVLDRIEIGPILLRIVLPPPPRRARRPGDVVAVTLTLPADLADAYADAEAAGGPRAPGRAALLQRAMRDELAARGLPCPPAPPTPPARVAAASAARVKRRKSGRR